MIASQLGISKRTLYENFKEKNELLLACLESQEMERRARLNSTCKSDQIFNSKYTFTEIFETIFKSFIRGIATPEGVKYTDEFFEENR